MSEEMAVSDNATGEDANPQQSATGAESVNPGSEVAPEQLSEAPADQQDNVTLAEENSIQQVEKPPPEPDNQEPRLDIKQELDTELDGQELNQQDQNEDILQNIKEEMDIENTVIQFPNKGLKRRASEAFSDDNDEEFKGFEENTLDIITSDYTQVLERLEAEVTAASKDFTPVRHVMATPSAPVRASKRPRTDTDGSRPSSAQSSRSEGDDNLSASPAHRGRRPTTEMSSPVLRIPLERGWKRELVYRAALDAYSRRNADIYYYTPTGKKLRSTREVSEQLSGTGLTLENFSFFKEPLGVDDPDKEIIRDAKMIRRNESPITSPALTPVEGKRTPKPKQPKGASPEPQTPKSPPAKLKVKSMGSRLSAPSAPAAAPPTAPAATPPTTPAATKQQKKTNTPAAAPAHTDNNNSAAWKKPSLRECSACGGRAPPTASAAPPAPVPPPAPLAPVPPPPHPHLASPTTTQANTALQPCSLACGAGVPSLSCRACLCLYHPTCAGLRHAPISNTFLCKNCRASCSPPASPPPVGARRPPAPVAPSASPPPALVRRPPAPAQPAPPDKRVLLRMKVSAGSGGNKVWAVSRGGNGNQSGGGAGAGSGATSGAVAGAAAGKLPQSLVIINGRRFIVVPRPAPLPTTTTN